MPYADPIKHKTYQREYNRAWKKRNPEKIAQYQKRYYELNRDRFAAKAKLWRESNPDRHKTNFRSWWYMVRIGKQYGLTPEDFEQILKSQNYCCAICREPFASTRHRHIDHCHDTNQVRGVLCVRCNLAVGHLRNSPLIAMEAAHYLNKAQAAPVTQAPQ